MEMSSPAEVESPLWQAKHRSEGWNKSILAVLGSDSAALSAFGKDSSDTAAIRKMYRRRRRLILLPTFQQAAVEPIPEHIEHELRRSSRSVVHRSTNSKICADMVAPIQRHLHFRQEIPIRSSPGYQITVHEKFQHGRPDAPEASVLCERLADRRIEEDRLRSCFGIHRQVSTGLNLEKAEPRKTLAELCKRSERRDAGTQITQPVARRQSHFAVQAEDRLATGEQDSFISQDQIPDSANPALVVTLQESVRCSEFELIPYTKTSFVNQFAVDAPRTVCVDGGCQNPFVFGKGFFGHQSAWQIHFSKRPCPLAAKRAKVTHHFVDLVQGQ